MTSFEKGFEFLEQCHADGARTILLTVESLRDAPWPRKALAEIYFMPSLYDRTPVFNAVSYLARTERFDRIVGLDELNVEMAAALREHLAMPGMNESTTRHFRDKLLMRVLAADAGIRVPAFTRTFPHSAVSAFLEQTPAPWVLKPRAEASAIGIRKLNAPEQVWAAISELGDAQSHHLIEQFIAGDVYHADAVVADGRIVFCEVQRYHKPPFDVYHGGGLFRTSTVPRGSDADKALRNLTQRVGDALGMDDGILHTEYIRGAADGEFYFLETAGRVGGAHIADLIEAATGINLWREWARLEQARALGTAYEVKPTHHEYGGVIMSLARQEAPDTSAYDDPEIARRIRKSYHAGFVLRSPDQTRVDTLLDSYAARFLSDFHTSLPPQTSVW